MSDEYSMRDQDRLQLPLALLVVAVFLMVAFQTIQLIRERDNLTAVRAQQEPTIQEATKVRQQLEAIAGATAKLADSGNANAKLVVEELRRQNINLKAPPGN